MTMDHGWREVILEKFAVGTSWRCSALGKSSRSDIIHIRGIVDDQIAYRWWRYHQRCWQYEFVTAFELWYFDRDGSITKA